MDSEIENDLSRIGTYFKNNFVQGIDEIRLKYEAKLSFKTFNVEALERDELALKGLIEVQGKSQVCLFWSFYQRTSHCSKVIFCLIFYC